jgi:hypothetical protein
MQKIEITYKVSFVKPEGKNPLANLSLDGRIL